MKNLVFLWTEVTCAKTVPRKLIFMNVLDDHKKSIFYFTQCHTTMIYNPIFKSAYILLS